ncbi:unnamed protein product, partial [Rotaria magnacalcarata]
EELELAETTSPETVNIEPSYKGLHVQLPIKKEHFEALILGFQRGEVL